MAIAIFCSEALSLLNLVMQLASKDNPFLTISQEAVDLPRIAPLLVEDLATLS
jgi:hypothetical protein